MPIIIPRKTENKPFQADLPVNELTHISEKAVNKVYSGGPKFSATAAKKPAATINIISLKVSPNTDE